MKALMRKYPLQVSAAAMLEKGNPLHSKYINKSSERNSGKCGQGWKGDECIRGNRCYEGQGWVQGDFQTLDSGLGPGTGSGIFLGAAYG